MMEIVAFAHAGSTLAMVGVIWFAQVVHYPLFARVGAEGFIHYQAKNLQLTGIVLGPMLFTEGVTALLLVWNPPPGIEPYQAWAGIALLAIIWVATGLFQMRFHSILAKGFRDRTHTLLVRTNWIRTVAWSARGVLAIWMVAAMH